jgi:hypothetical protein
VFNELECRDDIKRRVRKAGVVEQPAKYIESGTLGRLSGFPRYFHAAGGISQLSCNGKQCSAGAAYIKQTKRRRRRSAQQTESVTQPPLSHLPEAGG